MLEIRERAQASTRAAARAAALLALGVAWSGPAHAGEPLGLGAALATEEPLFSVESPIGPFVYRPGRGLAFGDTGLHVGGFTTLELERPEGEGAVVTLEGVNFLGVLEPVPWLRGFAEVEIGELLVVDTGSGEVDSVGTVEVDRLYGDVVLGDPLTVRVGKFLTPVGRWNLVPAEAFVWTTSEPVTSERAFDEHQTGAMATGSFFPGGRVLTYSLYGQLFDPLDADPEPPPADHSAGARVELGSALGDWSVAGSFLASERDGGWNYVGGVDALFALGSLRTLEAEWADGDFEERNLWGFYVQGVHELVPTLYLVARFEHVVPEGDDPKLVIGDLGAAWTPLPYLFLKADYRLVDHPDDDLARGFQASLSLLF